MKIYPKLDLFIERIIDLKPEQVWKAWTEPDILKKWFCPLPWKTVDCEIDLQPGGIFRTTMQSPEGKDFPGIGCYLELVKNKKIVWTSALLPGFRPAKSPISSIDMFFTATILMEPHEKGCKYSAIVIHGDEASCKKHKEMGFHEGWGKALDQLIEVTKSNTKK